MMKRVCSLCLLLGLAPLPLPGFTSQAWAAEDKKKDDKGSDKKKDDDDDLDLGKGADALPGEDDFKEEDEDAKPAPKPDAKAAPKAGAKADDDEEPPDDLDLSEKPKAGTTKFELDEEDDQSTKPHGPGEDTAKLYRDAQKAYLQLSPDEELIAWDAYLKKYPNSLFKDQINTRIEALSAQLFDERVPGSGGGGGKIEAAKRELNFATPVNMVPVDPRQKATAGFEFGFPGYFGVHADYEHQLQRNLSVHAGAWHLPTGGDVPANALVFGPRYALVKSSRTGTIVSGTMDFHLGINPTYFGVKPTIAVGQRVDVLDGLDLQAQVSADAEFSDPLGMRYASGVSAELRANKTVYLYGEGTMMLKHLSDDDVNTFRFGVATFGLRFVPQKGSGPNLDKRAVVGLNANVPYSYSYWGFYRGMVNADVNYYL